MIYNKHPNSTSECFKQVIAQYIKRNTVILNKNFVLFKVSSVCKSKNVKR